MTNNQRLILFALLIASAFSAFPHNYPTFESSNELSRLYLATAIARYGEIRINRVMSDWGPVTDKSKRDGSYYSDKAPGAAWLAVIPALALRGFSEMTGIYFNRDQALVFTRMIAVIFPSFFFLLFIFSRLPEFEDRNLKTAAILVYALATPAWVYSTLLYSHHLAAIALFTAWLLLRPSGAVREPPLRIAVAGFLLAYAVCLDYPVVWIVMCITIYGIRAGGAKRKWFWLGFAVPAALLAAYHWSAFGGPFTTGYSFKAYARDAAVHSQGILGIALPSLSALFGVLLSAKRGLFFFSPVLVFAIAGLIRMAKQERWKSDFHLCLAVILGHTLIIGSFGDWPAGWSYGPRHLLPMLPFLIPPLIVELEASGRWEKIAFACLFGISLLNTALAVTTFPHVPTQLDNPMRDLFIELLRRKDAGPILGGLGHKASVVVLTIIMLAGCTWMASALAVRMAWRKWLPILFQVSVIAAAAWFTFASFLPSQEGADKHFAMSQVYGALGDYGNTVMELTPLTLPGNNQDLRVYATYKIWKLAEERGDAYKAIEWRRRYLEIQKKGPVP